MVCALLLLVHLALPQDSSVVLGGVPHVSDARIEGDAILVTGRCPSGTQF